MAKVRESGMPDRSSWESFFDPACIVDRLGCGGDGDVVEFGCGYGTFTLPAAQRIRGTLFALDIDPAMLAETRRRLERAGLSNVRTIQRDFVAEGTGLPGASVRFAMLFNILHLERPVALLREAHRILAPGGLAGIIHWRKDPGTPRGPPMAMRPEPEDCRRWAEAAGFEFLRHEPLACCSWHWGVVFRAG